jgi:hypothetical protein
MTARAAGSSPVHGTEQTAGVFMPGRSVELDCSEEFAQVAIMIPRRDLQTELELLLDAPVSKPIEFNVAFDLATAGGQAVSQAIRLVDEISRRPRGSLAFPLAVRSLEQVFLHSLLLGQPHNLSAALDDPHAASGTRAVSRAVELLRDDPAHPWTVGGLAAAVCTSFRSLQEGFRRGLDTTPMAYFGDCGWNAPARISSAPDRTVSPSRELPLAGGFCTSAGSPRRTPSGSGSCHPALCSADGATDLPRTLGRAGSVVTLCR